MKNPVVILIIGLVICLNSAFAQQDPLISQYRFDGLILNPAYAGSANGTAGTLGYRQQFAGLDGAPQTQVFSIHSPILKKSMGIGLKAIRDNIGVTSQTSITAICAYHLHLAKGKLSFGLEGGLLNQSVDFPILITTDADDPLLANKESIILPDAAFGVCYFSEKFFLGASMYHLLQGELNYTGTPRTTIAHLFNHSFLTAGYSIDAGENIQLEPSLLLKYVSGAPVQTDINMNFTYKKMFTVGGGYRTSDAIIFLLKYSFKDLIQIGYAYDYTISKLASYNDGVHEFMLGYNIGRKPKEKKEEIPVEEIMPITVSDTSLVQKDSFEEDPLPDSTLSTNSDTAQVPESALADTLPPDNTALTLIKDADLPIESDITTEETEEHALNIAEVLITEEAEEYKLDTEEEIYLTTELADKGKTKLNGSITADGIAVQGVSIKLFKGVDLVKEIKTSEKGNFLFEISTDGDYWLYITKEGYFDKYTEIQVGDNNGAVTKNFTFEKKSQ